MYLTERAKISKPGHDYKTVTCTGKAYLNVCEQSERTCTNAGICISADT